MKRTFKLPPLDPFLLCLIVTVAVASLLPARGAAVRGFDMATDVAIALLFFLHGAKLSREAILDGVGKWRLHGLVLASTYVLFPVIGVALTTLESDWANPRFASGLLFLALLPSTVQSSIAFTAMARGNVAAAVCSASLSNLLGIVATPLLLALFGHIGGAGGGGAGVSGGAIRTIMVQLLLPFVAGHLLRPVIGGFVQRHKAILQPVDRSSILLVVYTAFSAAVVGGIWHSIDLADMAVLIANCAVMLALVMGVNVAVARLAGLPREDAIVLLFCGSKKSLVSGVPMAGALFPSAQVGQIVLPLMVFHQLQLFVCAIWAGRLARQPGADGDVPA
ncbi:MAG: bile acid:sodium symporter family protein [Sphingomonadales bacterium]|nr:bile acid:sodium symporter family protein [Sphingomonadales bacterium]